MLKHNFKVNIKNIYCTKIASKLTRTFTDKHGLKIERAAEARGVTPENMTDLNSKAFSALCS